MLSHIIVIMQVDNLNIFITHILCPVCAGIHGEKPLFLPQMGQNQNKRCHLQSAHKEPS